MEPGNAGQTKKRGEYPAQVRTLAGDKDFRVVPLTASRSGRASPGESRSPLRLLGQIQVLPGMLTGRWDKLPSLSGSPLWGGQTLHRRAYRREEGFSQGAHSAMLSGHVFAANTGGAGCLCACPTLSGTEVAATWGPYFLPIVTGGRPQDPPDPWLLGSFHTNTSSRGQGADIAGRSSTQLIL